MFKIESYITPIILSYVDKYIKNLKPEDSQVSLWGGDAVFNNLDLKLDVLEQELGTPFSFVNGHIHELRIHVPWTKLGSEPVVITINTIECILKLSDFAASEQGSSTSSVGEHAAGSTVGIGCAGSGNVSGSANSIKLRGEPKFAGKVPELFAAERSVVPPTNYVQSLINRVINNISIVCNNVILKYVEDDIVLSLNAKSVEVFSVNNKWERAFVDLTLPELILRKNIRLVDLTVCLDRRDASGKISIYQDPLLYKCSLDCRLHQAFQNIYGNRLLTTKLDILCDQLDFSVTDHQLTMFLRLIELGLALQAKELVAAAPTKINEEEKLPGDLENVEGSTVSWGSWLWSYVPSGISGWSEEDAMDEKLSLSSPVFQFGFYVKKATYMFKVEDLLSGDGSGFINRKINFRPLCALIIESQFIDVTSRGVDVFNLKMGASKITGVLGGHCPCGIMDSNNETKFFTAGVEDKEFNSSHSNLFIQDSLFDDESIENNGQHREYCFDWDQHFQIFSDEDICTKTPALALDYLYLLEIPDDISEKSSGISINDLENSSLKEKTFIRIFMTSPELELNSSVVHRFQIIMAASKPYDYEPYAKTKEDTQTDFATLPTSEEVMTLEKFVPHKIMKFILLSPVVKISMANHPNSVEEKSSQRLTKSKSLREVPVLSKLPIITITGSKLEFQQRTPLYPKRVVKIVSLLRSPSEYLMMNSHYCFGIELVDGSAFVSCVCGESETEVHLPLIEPCHLTFTKKSLLLPSNWKSPTQPHVEITFDAESLLIVTTAPEILLLKVMWASWYDEVWQYKQLQESSIINDAFFKQSAALGLSLRFGVESLTWKQSRNDVLKCYAGTVTSFLVEMEHIDNKIPKSWIPVFYGPHATTNAHTLSFFDNSELTDDPVDELTKSNPFISFSYQIPIDHNKIITPLVFFLHVGNSVFCVDSRLTNWISYRPFVRDVSETILRQQIAPEALGTEAHSKDSKIGSGMSVGDRATVTDASKIKSWTTASINKKINQNNSLTGPLQFVSDWYPVLQKLSIHVEFEGAHVYLCKNFIPWSHSHFHEKKLIHNIREMFVNHKFPQALVINLPLITIANDGQKMSLTNHMDIPIASVNGSDKFPWSLKVERYSSFTLDQHDLNYVIAPNSVASTFAVNSKSGHLNFMQLNVCFHCDFQPILFHLSHSQASFAAVIKDHVIKCLSFLSLISSSGSRVLVPSVNTWPCFYENSVADQTSRKTSGESDREKSISDVLALNSSRITETGVKVSLWLQATLPKLMVDVVGRYRDKDIRVCFEMEDVTCSFDVQEVYSKIKLKIASVKAKNYFKTEKSSEWKLGDYDGITFNSDQMRRRFYVSNMVPFGADSAHEHGSKSGELPDSFIIATFTCVQRKNVQKRWAKILRERSGVDETANNQTMGLACDTCRSRFISEIDLKLMPMEIVFNAPVAKCIFSVVHPLLILLPSSSSQSKSSAIPTLSTATLPLIYFSCTDVTVLFPHVTINGNEENQVGSIEKLQNDLVVLHLRSIDLTPNADNPLSRIVIKPDIFNVAQRAGILKIPGSEVEDRQYQIDIKGLSVSTGVWQQFLKASSVRTFELSKLKIMGENPAVEWNLKSLSVGDDFPATPLCPLISSFDLRIIAAPAIVYEKGEFGFHDNDVIIAGHSLEMNVTTNVTIYGGLHQLDLLFKTVSLMESELSNNDRLSDEFMRNKLNKSSREMDSGIESEATSCLGILLNYPALSPSPMMDFVPPVLSPQIPPSPLPCNVSLNQQETCKETTPYEVLLTAGLITVMLYFPENYLNVPKEMQFPKHVVNRMHSTPSFTSDGTGSKIRKRFQSPEKKRQTSSSSSENQLIQRRNRFRNKTRDNSFNISDTTVGYDGSEESSEEDGLTAEDIDSRIVPVFYVLISQPYTLVKNNKGSYKMELSCFDVTINGVNALRPIQSDFKLPKPQHFNATWLETVHGDADCKTGIHPSFYTVTVVSQTSKKPNITLKLERPVKMIWNTWKYMKLNFLMENLSNFKSNKAGSPVMHSEQQSPLNLQKWMHLFNDISFNTKQLVVVLEANETNVGEGRMIFSITDCNALATTLCDNLQAEELSCATLGISMNGCLLKNQFIDSEPRSFIGPFSASFETTVKWESWATVPIVLMKLALDTVIVNVDQTHLKCMSLVINNLTSVKIKSEDSASELNWLLEFDKVTDDYKIWQDDLRVGIFQYTQNSDDQSVLPLLPGPNEIVFRKEQAGFGASMTWKYPEPRTLIRTEIHPVPFKAAADAVYSLNDEDGDYETEVSCALQYWDQLRGSFITCQTFCLSETVPCILDLPPADVELRRELIVSSTWRVLMNYSNDENESDDEPLNSRNRCSVSPLALAACMRVDSCFRLSIIPNLQILFSMDLMKIVFRNHLPAVDSSSICESISPFKLDGTMPSYQEFLLVTLENVNLFDRHWNGECKVELDVVARLEIVDYNFLTLQPLMDPVPLHGQLLASLDRTKQKPHELEVLFNAGNIFFYVSPQSMHTLTMACSSWIESEKESKSFHLLSAYLICNNSLDTIRFGQVDTDENIVLFSQQAHAYSWRTTKYKQIIHACIEGMRWKWCEPFDIDSEGIQVIKVESDSRKATLIIRIKQLNPIQKQVIISGQVIIANRLCLQLDVRIKRNTKQSSNAAEEISAVIPSNGYLPSFIIQYEDSWIIQLRAALDGKNKNTWTSPIALDNNRSLTPMQIIDSNGKEINFWCNVFQQSVANVTRQLIVLCPLYIVRSYLPQPLSLEIHTPSFGELTTTINLEGKSVYQHLHCPGKPNLPHSLKFRIKPESMASSQSLSLTPNAIKSALKSQTESLLDIDTICEDCLNSEHSMWPYDYFEEQKESKCESEKHELSISPDWPITELEVTLKQRWSGCDTLLIDVKPWALVTNRSSIDCILVFKSSSKEQTIIIPANSVTALPKLTQSAVQLGIVCNEDYYFSKPLSLIGYDDGWFTVNKSKSVQEDYQHVDITMTTLTPKVCLLTLARMENAEAEMNVFTIRSRYVLSNFSTSSVALALFARSSSVSKASLNIRSISYQVVEPNVTEVELLIWERVGEDNELLVPHVKFCHSDDSTKWSIPIRLGSEEEIIGHRMDYMYSVVIPPSAAYRVCCQEHRGSIVLIMSNDEMPQLQLHNYCPVKLYIAQGTSQPVDDGTESSVSDEYLTIAIDEIASVESMTTTYYTLPFVTQKFPQIYEPTLIPRLHLAEGSTQSDATALDWSSGILFTSDTDQFIAIPNCGDIKVHIERISATTHLFLDPVNRIEVSAKEIRSRIKRNSQSKKVGKFSRSPSLTSLNTKWRIEDTEDTSSVGPPSPLLLVSPSSSPKPKLATKLKESSRWSVYGVFHLSHICIVISGSTKEVLRISIDHLLLATRTLSDSSVHLKSFERTNRQQEFLQEIIICLGDLQVDNQLHCYGGYDFPVVLLRQDQISPDVNWNEISSARRHSLFTITTIVQGQGSNMSKWLVKDMEIYMLPVAIYSEDSLVYALIDLMKNIQFSAPTKRPRTLQLSEIHPHSTLIVRRLVVQPITLLLSLRLSTKVFISFDHTPLKFRAFERTLVWTTWYRLGHTLALHYMSGALINAGWVIGSMDLLANPGGFARAVGTGVSDLFRLPYRGLMNGPWSFISGIVQGTSSLISHIGSGTVMSITNLAASISRNMDHFAMDHVHLERNEELRRSPPQGLAAGLSQGLTGFGVSLLGAMAGIVHQPLQSMYGAPSERPLTHTAAGILTGVGRGLVGVVVKPIGGAAEFVAQAGQGILHGAGWIRVYKARYEPVINDLANSQNSFLKYVWKMLPNSRSSNDLILTVEATHINSCGNYSAISLLLTTEVLFVVSLDTDSQQQAFGLTEFDCQADHNDPTLIHFFNRKSAEDESQCENKPNDRVAEFVDRATKYTAKSRRGIVQTNTIIDESESCSSSCSSPPSYHADPWNSNIPIVPVVSFYLPPRLRDIFIKCYTIAQRNVLGKGFN
ncbi:Vacuolar protein sorting-associated protein 13B [Chamberlinius hualienensis]